MGTKDLLIQALHRVEEQDLEGALDALEEAARAQPDNRGIQRILAETRQALESQEPVSAAPPGPVAVPDVTSVGRRPAPTGFFQFATLQRVDFFGNREALYETINNSLEFYREHLNREYNTLSHQADLVFKLWVACVLVGFSTLIGGLTAVFLGYDLGGAVTTACSTILLFIHRVFQKREEYYRALAEKKQRHLEYGNQWLLTIQSIDAMPDSETKRQRQARLVEVMTEKLLGRG